MREDAQGVSSMTYDFERERGIEERLEHQGNPPRREDRKVSHIEEIALAAAEAVRSLMSAGNLRRVDSQTKHASITAILRWRGYAGRCEAEDMSVMKCSRCQYESRVTCDLCGAALCLHCAHAPSDTKIVCKGGCDVEGAES